MFDSLKRYVFDSFWYLQAEAIVKTNATDKRTVDEKRGTQADTAMAMTVTEASTKGNFILLEEYFQ